MHEQIRINDRFYTAALTLMSILYVDSETHCDILTGILMPYLEQTGQT